jgi:hypothetical protein
MRNKLFLLLIPILFLFGCNEHEVTMTTNKYPEYIKEFTTTKGVDCIIYSHKRHNEAGLSCNWEKYNNGS